LEKYPLSCNVTADEYDAIIRDGFYTATILPNTNINPPHSPFHSTNSIPAPAIIAYSGTSTTNSAHNHTLEQKSAINQPTIKFDTACSSNLSGDVTRLQNPAPIDSIKIKGFNNSTSSVTHVGSNADGKKEYFVPTMPPNLVLLCAQQYSSDGASILLPNEGFVLQLSATDQQFLRDFAHKHHISKHLTVKNNTYEVLLDSSPTSEEAFSSSATKYFNSKVNVSNTQERILATLLTGLTFNDLHSFAKHNSVLGLPRDITQKTLNSFEHNFGRTPDILQLAFPDLSGNKKGYMAPKKALTQIGERVEADFFDIEFNDITDTPTPTPSTASKRSKHAKKLATFGGATAGFVYIDVYTGRIGGTLVNSKASALTLVQSTHQDFKNHNHTIQLFSADQGILHQSQFRVATPDVQQYLLNSNIHCEVGEAYNHNIGTPHIEKTLRPIQELIRFAMLYVLRNPNFKHFGFSRTQILKLWGEIFYWAIVIINLKPSYHNPTITKHEHFTGQKPDLRAIRLLPIFSSLYVLRHAEHKELQSNHVYWQLGLYVGPSLLVPGAIRAAVITNNTVQIITTSVIKAVSDGGHISIYPTITASINCLREDTPVPEAEDSPPVAENSSLIAPSIPEQSSPISAP